MTDQSEHVESAPAPDGGVTADRRRFLAASSTVAMAGGLAGGYGMFAYVAGAYLYSDENGSRSWQFVARAADVQSGRSLTYVSPAGDKVVVARQGEGSATDDFIALSSVCPHLGCQVHWEAHRNRFSVPAITEYSIRKATRWKGRRPPETSGLIGFRCASNVQRAKCNGAARFGRYSSENEGEDG